MLIVLVFTCLSLVWDKFRELTGIGKYSYYEVNQQTVIWEEVTNDVSVLAAKSETFKEKEH